MYDKWVNLGPTSSTASWMTRIIASPRYGDVYADDPADAAALAFNQRLESRHETWLKKLASKPY